MRLFKLVTWGIVGALVIADFANWIYAEVKQYQAQQQIEQQKQQREAEFRAIFDRMWQRMNDGTSKSETREIRQY